MTLEQALELDHPNCTNNSCDITAAIRAGYPECAAHLLLGAVECPNLEKYLEQNPIPMKDGWPANFDEWAQWFKANTIQCNGCGAYNFTDEFTPDHCANCLATLPKPATDENED